MHAHLIFYYFVLLIPIIVLNISIVLILFDHQITLILFIIYSLFPATSCLFYTVDKKMPPVRISTRRKKELVGMVRMSILLCVIKDSFALFFFSPLF